MKINWRFILDYALSMGTTCKRYEVSLGNYNGGHSEWFWCRPEAEQRFNEAVRNKEAPFIRLMDWFWTHTGPERYYYNQMQSTMGYPLMLGNWQHDSGHLKYGPQGGTP